MHPGQRETCVLQVIETHTEPVIEVMTLFASNGEASGRVTRSAGCHKVLGMAGIASGRQSLELSDSRTLMAGVASKHGVRSHEREAVLVLLDLLH